MLAELLVDTLELLLTELLVDTLELVLTELLVDTLELVLTELLVDTLELVLTELLVDTLQKRRGKTNQLIKLWSQNSDCCNGFQSLGFGMGDLVKGGNCQILCSTQRPKSMRNWEDSKMVWKIFNVCDTGRDYSLIYKGVEKVNDVRHLYGRRQKKATIKNKPKKKTG